MESGKVINCNGTCGRLYHFTCVGMSKSQFTAWTAKIGLYWFCESCRLNFEPAVYDRDKTIMKALRELLIRTNSMDTRLANYGENLRKINSTIFGPKQQSKSSTDSLHQSNFLQQIDEMTLDDTTDDPINRSRSCENTSFFEVLDEVNGSIALLPDKFVVGANKRVQIIANPSSGSGSSENSPRITVSTPAATNKQTFAQNDRSSRRHTDRITNPSVLPGDRMSVTNSDRSQNGVSRTRPEAPSLKVANITSDSHELESFYVTPFAPDQNEEEVKRYVREISNVHTSLVNVVKLVPRGRNAEDLSFVSFKVTVSKTVSNVVGDPWYWPEGITVRTFEPNPKNGSATRLPVIQ